LNEENPEWKLREVFRHAESLHVNFYEDHLPEDYIIESKMVIEGALKSML
jgi:hypothetical protein